MKCDVLIVGAGVAGLYLARELTKAKLQVIVIDESKNPGEPNFSTAGTFLTTVQKFSLPREGIAGEINRIGFGTSLNSHFWKTSELCTLDFRKTKQLLANEAVSLGADVRWDVKALNIKENSDKCITGTSAGDIESKFTVDAAGSRRALLPPARDKKKERITEAIEVIAEDPKGILEKYFKTQFLCYDVNIAPFGYAWAFYNGNNTYKVGIVEFNIDLKQSRTPLNNRLKSYIRMLDKDEKLLIAEEHGNTLIVSQSTPAYQQGNVLAIGDAAYTINPLLGEGIRHSLYSALFAYEAITENMHNNKPLTNYEHKIRKYKNLSWQMTYKLGKALYGRNTGETQELYENFIKFGNYLNSEEIIKLARDYSLVPLLNGFPHNLPLFKSLLKTII
jgi:flavin-dependent dehydrogenase